MPNISIIGVSVETSKVASKTAWRRKRRWTYCISTAFFPSKSTLHDTHGYFIPIDIDYTRKQIEGRLN